jgi:hypothetical protein
MRGWLTLLDQVRSTPHLSDSENLPTATQIKPRRLALRHRIPKPILLSTTTPILSDANAHPMAAKSKPDPALSYASPMV